MGEYRPEPSKHPSMWNFRPDDTDEYFYIAQGATTGEIANRATEKWGVTGWVDLHIEAEYIHTRCIYYDLYDASDYSNYLKITRIQ